MSLVGWYQNLQSRILKQMETMSLQEPSYPISAKEPHSKLSVEVQVICGRCCFALLAV